MKPYVPRRKRSNRRRREEDRLRRVTWRFSPVTRVKQSGKRYSRRAKHSEHPDEGCFSAYGPAPGRRM